eukprot:gene28649-36955_t
MWHVCDLNSLILQIKTSARESIEAKAGGFSGGPLYDGHESSGTPESRGPDGERGQAGVSLSYVVVLDKGRGNALAWPVRNLLMSLGVALGTGGVVPLLGLRCRSIPRVFQAIQREREQRSAVGDLSAETVILDVDKSILLDVILPPLEDLLPVATEGNTGGLETRMPRVMGYRNGHVTVLCPVRLVHAQRSARASHSGLGRAVRREEIDGPSGGSEPPSDAVENVAD